MPSFFPREVLDEILSRTDLISLISQTVPLKKSGKDYKGLCPFHQEKTPSFMVSPEKQIYHCFGCGQGGNAYGFLMKIDNLSFPEAVKKLATAAGVDISSLSLGEKSESKDIYYKINRYAAWYFADLLSQREGGGALQYLNRRGFNKESIAEFKLGCAGKSWEGLVNFLKEKKVPLEKASELGLIRKGDSGGYYDFFRHRVMFPIMDFESRFVGFSGRRLDDADPKAGGKYINSPESPIYHKGLSIYGLAQAKSFLRETGEVVLVEGNLDLVALHQAGIKNVVAPLGTAVTEGQIALLARFAKNFVLMFDGDSAGRAALLRAIPLFLKSGFHPRVVLLPPGEDPDLAVKKRGGDWIRKNVAESLPAVEWMMVEGLTMAGSSTAKRVLAVKEIIPVIAQLPTEMEREAYRAKMARILGLGERAVAEMTGKASGFKGGGQVIKTPVKISLERNLLQLYVRYPQIGRALIDSIVIGQFEDESLKELGLKINEQVQLTGSVALNQFFGPDHPFEENFVSGLAFDLDENMTDSQPQKVISDCLKQLKRQRVKNELLLLTGEIHLAEIRKDAELVSQLVMKKNEMMKGLADVIKAVSDVRHPDGSKSGSI